jgi:hypothetical protein
MEKLTQERSDLDVELRKVLNEIGQSMGTVIGAGRNVKYLHALANSIGY